MRVARRVPGGGGGGLIQLIFFTNLYLLQMYSYGISLSNDHGDIPYQPCSNDVTMTSLS